MSWMTSDLDIPWSNGLSSASSACDHKLSLRPSQNCHGEWAAPTSVGVFRGAGCKCVAGCTKPSVKALSGWWQLAHAVAPLWLKSVSKNSRCPNAAAAGELANLFVCCSKCSYSHTLTKTKYYANKIIKLYLLVSTSSIVMSQLIVKSNGNPARKNETWKHESFL